MEKPHFLEGNSSDSLINFAKAFCEMQGELTNAPFDSVNPHFRNKYASLAGIINHVRPTLSKHGFSFFQTTSSSFEIAQVETVLLHTSGEFIKSITSLKPSKSDPQGLGSAFTYAKRYGLTAILGISSEEDDDGQQASKPQSTSTNKPQSTTQNVKPQDNTKEIEALRTEAVKVWATLYENNVEIGTDRDGNSLLITLQTYVENPEKWAKMGFAKAQETLNSLKTQKLKHNL